MVWGKTEGPICRSMFFSTNLTPTSSCTGSGKWVCGGTSPLDLWEILLFPQPGTSLSPACQNQFPGLLGSTVLDWEHQACCAPRHLHATASTGNPTGPVYARGLNMGGSTQGSTSLALVLGQCHASHSSMSWITWDFVQILPMYLQE